MTGWGRYTRIAFAVVTAGAATLFWATHPAAAAELTAGSMLEQMNDRDQYHYIAGVVAGLATARAARDGDETGSSCIEGWFYDAPGTRETIAKAFARFGDKSPSAILYALTAKECGK